MRSKLPTKTLPKGWWWRVHEDNDPTFGSCDADLYAPTGCRAGEVRKPALPTTSKYYSHTWDEYHCGGENSIHDSLEKAMAFVEAAINRQKFHMECEYDCSDTGCEETAAEVASEHYPEMDDNGKLALRDVVQAMLGPKRYREWCEENDV